MNDTITSFNLALQTHMKDAQNRMAELNTKAAAGLAHAEVEMRKQVKALDESAKKTKATVEAANAEVKKWAEDSVSVVTAWKEKFDVAQLTGRADRAEHYAKAASQIAISGVQAAEKAALDAKLARSEAEAAKAGKAA